MSANVRCAGLPVETRGREEPTDYDLLPGCGWKGERAKTWDAPTGYERAATAKPCPRCGSPVELIPEWTP